MRSDGSEVFVPRSIDEQHLTYLCYHGHTEWTKPEHGCDQRRAQRTNTDVATAGRGSWPHPARVWESSLGRRTTCVGVSTQGSSSSNTERDSSRDAVQLYSFQLDLGGLIGH